MQCAWLMLCSWDASRSSPCQRQSPRRYRRLEGEDYHTYQVSQYFARGDLWLMAGCIYGPSGVVSLGSRGRLMPVRPGMTTACNDPYGGFRFSAEIIHDAVCLYHCFSLSLRDVELILAERGIVVSYGSIREWGICFRELLAGVRNVPQCW